MALEKNRYTFEKKVKDNIVSPAIRQSSNGGNGVILAYDAQTNTATVLMSRPDSDEAGDILTGVLCPTQIGVQGVAPEPGRECWVAMRNGSTKMPIITTYYNRIYTKMDYNKQTKAVNPVPRFMYDI